MTHLDNQWRKWPRDPSLLPLPGQSPAATTERVVPRINPAPTPVLNGYEWNLMGSAMGHALYDKTPPSLPYEWPGWSEDARASFVTSIERWISTTRGHDEYDRRLVARARTVIEMAREYDDDEVAR